MKVIPLPPVEFLKECFSLEEPEGNLKWNVRPRSHFKSDHVWKMWNSKFSLSDAGVTCVDHRNKYRRVKVNRTDFERALLLSGITDFRFHDLRHTWASWHVQNGTPLMVLKELGGWEKLEMVNKYAHLSGEHLSKFSGIVTFLAQDTESTNDAVRISLVS